jgi:hypothetical protein
MPLLTPALKKLFTGTSMYGRSSRGPGKHAPAPTFGYPTKIKDILKINIETITCGQRQQEQFGPLR